MLTDPLEQRLTDVLRAARPVPPPGWRSQALAAMADVRPRRHPNLVTIIVVALILLALAAGACAAVRFFVKGTLTIRDFDLGKPRRDGGSLRVLTEGLGWQAEDPFANPSPSGFQGSVAVSPVGDQVCFNRPVGWPPEQSDLFTAKSNGADELNVTHTAGLGGVNC